MAFAFPGAFPSAPTPWKGQINAAYAEKRRRTRKRSQLAWSLPAFFQSKNVRFERVRVEHNKSLPHSEIRAVFDHLLGGTVARSSVVEAVDALSEWYRTQGYLFSAVKVSTWPSEKSPVLILECMESVLDSINLVSVSKDGVPDPTAPPLRTRVGTVERALGVKTGAPFRWADEKFTHLMSLGVFEKAKVEVNIVGPDRVKLNVYLNELATARIEPGLGMNGDGRFFGDISVLDRNFMGRAQILRVEWQRRLDMVKSGGGLEFDDPRIGASVPFSYKARAYRKADSARGLPADSSASEMRVGPFRSVLNPDADSDRDGAFVLTTFNLPRFNMSCTAGPIAERVHWASPVDGAWVSENRDQLAWKSIVAHSTVKSPFAPREGHRFSVDHLLGMGVRGANGGLFQRLALSLSKYVPVGSLGSFNFSSSLGVSSSNLPSHEMMPLGGNHTVRGYVYGELGRPASYRTTRLEFRMPFPVGPAPPESVDKFIEKGKRSGESTSANVEKSDGPAGPPVGPKVGDSAPSPAFLERLPSLVGYVFADSATAGAFESVVSGSSHGVGLRVAGLFNFELTRAAHGRPPRLNVTLVNAGS